MKNLSRSTGWGLAPSKIVGLIVILVLAVGTSAAADDVAGEIRWFDLVTEDAATANSFYSELLGWQIEVSPTGSYVALLDGKPIAGISQVEGKHPESDESTWLVAIIVEDLQASIGRAEELGGKILEPINRAEGYGSWAVIEDPQGAPAMLAVTERSLGGKQGPGSWVWAELWSDDVDAAASFYSEVVGYEKGEVDVAGSPYSVLKTEGEPRAGLVTIQQEGIKPAWAPYLGVDDLGTILKKAKSLGGKVLLEPSASLGRGRIALLSDPVGGTFFIFQIEGEGP